MALGRFGKCSDESSGAVSPEERPRSIRPAATKRNSAMRSRWRFVVAAPAPFAALALAIVACLVAAPAPVSAQSVPGPSLEDLFEDPVPPWFGRAESRSRRGEGDAAEEPLETDRDSFTFATNTVGRGRLLLEAAHSYLDNRRDVDSHSYPEFIARYGLTERLEARLGWNHEVGGGGDVTGSDATGDEETPGSVSESKITYGLKYALTNQERWVPESAVILQGSTPTEGPESSSQSIVGYAFGWTIFEEWKLDAALRYGTALEGDDRFSQWAPSIVLKVPVGERWNVHGEYFGIFTDGKANESNAQYFSPGVHYLLTPRCEIGVRVGWGLSQDAANFFSNVGIGLMF